MKRLSILCAIVCLLASWAAAQGDVFYFQKADPPNPQAALEKMTQEFKIISLNGAAMGATVKGAP